MAITRPKGTNDFMPDEVLSWQYMENILRDLCKQFGYMELRTPIFEDTELFIRGVDDSSRNSDHDLQQILERNNPDRLSRRDNTWCSPPARSSPC